MVTINTVTIARIGKHKTVKFAANELAKYLKQMDGNAIIDTRIYDDYDETLKDVLWLGMSESFNDRLPKVEDKKFDDAILIDVENYCGVITGANERAVLIAAYRFLRELGVAFIRPGEGNEIIPKIALDECRVNVCEAPSYRNRFICLEGANSYQHVYNIINWLPKAGMNGYDVQFFSPYTFFDRWYVHENNAEISGKKITTDDVEHILSKVEEDIEERGLLYRTPGHGWTSDPFGVKGMGWFKYTEKLPEKYESVLALVKGKRELQGGIPLNTNLCYTDPYVIKTICDFAVDYCRKKPMINYIQFTLADGRNSHCECENCINLRPSDLYVNLMNKLDEAFTENGIDAKICFSVYTDMMWIPLVNNLKNKDRFVLQFAPITRNYLDSYADMDLDNLGEIPEFVRNNINLPRDVKPNLAMLKKWLENVNVGSAYVFDYHLWTTTNLDIGRFGHSRTLYRDIVTLEKMGLCGMTSCQVQRHGFPNNLFMETMAQTLWNKNIDFDEMATKLMKDSYGSQYALAKDYLEELSRLVFPAPFIGGSEALAKLSDPERKEMSEKALALALSVREKAQKILDEGAYEYEAQKKSWEYLIYNTHIAEKVARVYIKRFSVVSPCENNSDNSKALEMEKAHRELNGVKYYFKLMEKFEGAPREEIQPELDKLGCYLRTIEKDVHEHLDVWRTVPSKDWPYFLVDFAIN